MNLALGPDGTVDKSMYGIGIGRLVQLLGQDIFYLLSSPVSVVGWVR